MPGVEPLDTLMGQLERDGDGSSKINLERTLALRIHYCDRETENGEVGFAKIEVPKLRHYLRAERGLGEMWGGEY